MARPTNPRQLLARLRDVMAGAGTPQERLDRVTRLIAEGIGADVCTCYVMRAGEVLELFATYGLKETAVHKTRLRVGEGLVGEVAAHAKPLALSDAWSHPQFVYRAETGEDVYRSLAGVPIIRAGKVIGVLVVQNKEERAYLEEELEVFETVAMVFAELLNSSEIIGRDELAPANGIGLLPVRFEGVKMNGGIAIGEAVLHKPRARIQTLVAEDSSVEHERLQKALDEALGEVDDMLASGEQLSQEYKDVLETYRMFAEDRGWIAKISEAIDTGLTAEGAVQKVADDTHVRMSQISDPYIRERLHDIEDLSNRLLQRLMGGVSATVEHMPDDAIIVAKTMGPAELLDYDREKLRGLVLEDGAATNHVAIVARALDIPVLGKIPGLLDKIEPHDPVVIDGDRGQMFLRPGDDIRQAFELSLKARQEQLAKYAACRDLPAVTADGEEVSLNVNAGLLLDVDNVHANGANGIGLYRTEIAFMARSSLPDVKAQTGLYSRVMDSMDGKPVVFRTLDVGGDKVLPYWNSADEDNPMMGWRSVRITLDRPMILRHQLRALIHAAAGRELRVMFPMISEVSEFLAARATLDLELERERKRGGVLPSKILVGSMLEVPALTWQLPLLLKHVDFISIGSNDLLQFMFANDRNNPRLSDRYDPLSLPVIRMLQTVVRQCGDAGVPLSLCGELAGEPLGAMMLVSLGFRRLSMNANSIGPVKAMIRSMDAAQVQDYVLSLLDTPSRSLRAKLRAYAKDHGVVL